MKKQPIVGKKKDIETLDGILNKMFTPQKDTKGICDSYTRTYLVPVPQDGRMLKVRLWLNNQTGLGTIKFQEVKMPPMRVEQRNGFNIKLLLRKLLNK